MRGWSIAGGSFDQHPSVSENAAAQDAQHRIHDRAAVVDGVFEAVAGDAVADVAGGVEPAGVLCPINRKAPA